MKRCSVNSFRKPLTTALLALSSFSVSLAVVAEQGCWQNIQCPESDGWEKTTRAVVRVSSGDGGRCSGTLLNNTAEDNSVYVVTAGHCFDSENETGISIDFNYEIACNADRDGAFVRPRNHQTLENGYLVAWDPSIDAALIRFESPIPDGVDAYFAGWDLTEESSSEPHALIHHLAGGAKSIALVEGGRIFSQSTRFFNPLPQGNYYERKWHTRGYSLGYMGGGSSGSGLFYGDEYFVGILNGNVSGTEVPNSCENGPRQQIRHTQLGHIWEPDLQENPPIIPLAFSNFKTHLDPLNTGVTRFRGKEVDSTITPTQTPTPMPTQTPTSTPEPTPTPNNGGYFYIVHKPTGAKLKTCENTDASVVTSAPNTNGWFCVQWKKIPNGEFFHLKHRFSGKRLAPAKQDNGSSILIQPNTWTGNWTQWQFVDTGDDFGRLVHKHSGKYIFLSDTGADPQLQPSSWQGDYTRWKFEAIQ